MATIYLVARSLRARRPERSIRLGAGKLLKILILFTIASSLLGCASTQGTAFDRQLLLELEEKNTRLEAEVTRLREEKLRAAPETDCSADDDPSATDAAPDERPLNLPVVEMNPTDSVEELEPRTAMIRPAEPPPEEEPLDGDTRPVLKVHGRHEAWVYHRPATEEDRQAKTDPPRASKKLPEEPSSPAPSRN